MYNSTQASIIGDMAKWTDQTSTLSNGSNGSSIDEEAPLTEFRTIILPCIYAIVAIVGLIGNGLVVYIMQVKVR